MNVPRKAVAREPKTARTRLEVDERRAQLIALGLAHFSTRAYDEVSIDDVAQAASISKGLLYHYFPTKRDFYVATIREAAKQLLRCTEIEAGPDPLDRLRRGLDAFLLYVREHGPAYAALLHGGVGSDVEVTQIIEETRAEFVNRLVLEVGGEHASPLLRTAVAGWRGFVESASVHWVEHRGVEPVLLREMMVELFYGACRLASQNAQSSTQ